MKKIISVLVITILVLATFAGCGSDDNDQMTVLTVGASTTPHAEILAFTKDILAEQGIDLQIKEFEDYILPNLAVDSGEIDANYFQHQTYLDNFNQANKTNLVSVADVHYEPYGIYAGKVDSLDKLTKGSKVAVTNDPTNEGRALMLLQQAGLIELDPAAGITATILDITANPLELDIVELEAATIPRALEDVDVGVINGNYAIAAGFNVATDALAVEAGDSLTAEAYVNVLCVNAGNEDNPAVQALVKVLLSDETRAFIELNYEGSVIPSF